MPDPVTTPRRGRNALCSAEQLTTLLDTIAGTDHITACLLAGIEWSDFQPWFARGDADPNRDFTRAVLKAEAESEASAAQTMQTAGVSDWRANASWLGRRHRDRWSKQPARAEPGGNQVVINIAASGDQGPSAAIGAPGRWTTVPQLPAPPK